MKMLTYGRKWHGLLRRFRQLHSWKEPAKLGAFFLLGFSLSAASLGNYMQPIALGVLCGGLSGWLPLPFVLGSGLGCWVFWGQDGLQGLLWLASGLPVCVLLGSKRTEPPLLQPALSALLVSATGVLLQIWMGENTPILIYLLRIGVACGSTWLWQQVRRRGDGAADWAALALWVLALAQIAPLPFLGLGFAAAAIIANRLPFPAVALAGLALDLAQVTPVPMTAVLCLSYLLRLLPLQLRRGECLAPAMVYLPVMALCGQWDLMPLPALALGGLGSLLLPRQTHGAPRRGETGFAQVRLEMAAGVLAQTEQQLRSRERAIDASSLVYKAVERACLSCPCRKTCKHLEQARQLPEELLYRLLGSVDDLPLDCKKRGRVLLELRRSQDQLRLMQADRDRQREYRAAVQQQYQFLSEYLQDLADQLPRRGSHLQQRFQPEVAVCSAGKESANGDRCLWFAGTQCKYYLLLCDGMGTGPEAAEEAKNAGAMLRKLLMAGFPAAHALRSLNSLCTLRSGAGAVTVDLAELHLQTGRVTVYKWGAAPSYLLTSTGPERLGQPGLPPGLSVTEFRETVDQVSMGRGELLVLFSDGVEAEAAIPDRADLTGESPGALAARFLELGKGDGADDATAAVVRLMPVS